MTFGCVPGGIEGNVSFVVLQDVSVMRVIMKREKMFLNMLRID
jgi:hypothetical protein